MRVCVLFVYENNICYEVFMAPFQIVPLIIIATCCPECVQHVCFKILRERERKKMHRKNFAGSLHDFLKNELFLSGVSLYIYFSSHPTIFFFWFNLCIFHHRHNLSLWQFFFLWLHSAYIDKWYLYVVVLSSDIHCLVHVLLKKIFEKKSHILIYQTVSTSWLFHS